MSTNTYFTVQSSSNIPHLASRHDVQQPRSIRDKSNSELNLAAKRFAVIAEESGRSFICAAFYNFTKRTNSLF